MCPIGTHTASVSRTFSDVVGFDCSEKAVRIAGRTADRAGARNCHFAAGDVADIPFTSSSSEVAFLNRGSLAWIYGLPSALRELRRVLRPGAHLVVVDQHPVSLIFRRGFPLPRRCRSRTASGSGKSRWPGRTIPNAGRTSRTRR
ncbi:class I SAM-dependent methyltransferase [Streptomyces sp. NPDC005573]|uniref:class I SAM-dependent methyltransferase n=1 Tax=Streptomyces sp. NPDC005573 TaxID=3156890 RepID=UPI0033A877B9